ncbi:DUF2157 domain-containing protein [Oscillatoria sp. FACHB-1406]|uniref:DUF2157 domain-containing protein n=1 Tax=Oscillatoria sp. FACHB-1406 TaxID=2692846 RepID=UPI001685B9FB|nr:DUF2157 domain-containing protein [Oscillatoria sp. FACHB-1406]MBD2578666.1 DUF2157 domain-containing protein [Oscillatoria sp. FACHB-1406]
MVSEKFRQQLRQEVEQWRSQGLIDDALYHRLSQRYELNSLDTAYRNRFISILLGLGSILLSLAVITFVAANWQYWSRSLKVSLLLSLFAGINCAGFYFWRQRAQGWKVRLGQSLLLLGGLLLGANMALMSQMFHQSSPLYHLFLLWGLGVLLMAYSLRLTVLAMLGLILVALGYVSSVVPSAFLYRWGEASALQLAVQHLPLLASVLFVPLAYRCRSRWLFGGSLLLIVGSLETNLLFLSARLFDASASSAELVAAIACTLPPAVLWAYRDAIWERSAPNPSFDAIARGMSIFFLSMLFYVLSFRGWWLGSPQPGDEAMPLQIWAALLDAFILGGFTLYAWWKLGVGNRAFWCLDRTSTVVGMAILVTGWLIWWHGRVEALGAIAIFAFNALLFLLAIGCVRESLGSGKRRGFWWGMVSIVLQLTSRMLEYNTDLLFKAIVLFFCGVAVILAGLWFERYLLTLHSPAPIPDKE